MSSGREIKRKAMARDRYVLELYERRGVSYEKLGLELGVSASMIGIRVRRGRVARAWTRRSGARDLKLFRERLSRIDGERRPARGR